MKLTGVAYRVLEYYYSGSLPDVTNYTPVVTGSFAVVSATQTVNVEMYGSDDAWRTMETRLSGVNPSTVGMHPMVGSGNVRVRNESGFATHITMAGWRYV